MSLSPTRSAPSPAVEEAQAFASPVTAAGEEAAASKPL